MNGDTPVSAGHAATGVGAAYGAMAEVVQVVESVPSKLNASGQLALATGWFVASGTLVQVRCR
jgi:hypothetical protein